MSTPRPVRKPSVFFAAMLRGPAADCVEQTFTASGLKQKLGKAGWPRGNRHQSLSNLLPHPLDLKTLLKVGAAVDCAPVVLRFNRIESRGKPDALHWELRLENGAALNRLLDAVRLALFEHGLDKGARNTPHITLSYRAPFALEKPVGFYPVFTDGWERVETC